MFQSSRTILWSSLPALAKVTLLSQSTSKQCNIHTSKGTYTNT